MADYSNKSPIPSFSHFLNSLFLCPSLYGLFVCQRSLHTSRLMLAFFQKRLNQMKKYVGGMSALLSFFMITVVSMAPPNL